MRLAHELMRQLHADIPGDLVAVEALRGLLEQHASLGDPRVAVLVALIQQGARQAVEIIAGRIALIRFNRVQLRPQVS